MATDPRLDNYLSRLDRVLAPFPAGDRAEIITEIKSHVLTALERDPQAQLDTVLRALGEPETVANRYLMERGLKPTRPPVSPIVKWLVIGFLGTVAMVLLFIGVLVFSFSPVVKIDGADEFVSILGGAIEFDGKKETVKIGGSIIGEGELDHGVEGTWEPKGPNATFNVKFPSGKVELKNAEGSSLLSWVCKTSSEDGAARAPTDTHPVLDLSQMNRVRCQISVPEKLNLMVNGKNGRVFVDQPRFHLNVVQENGKVELSPDKNVPYSYSLSVSAGKIDKFESSTDPHAYKIVINLKHGKISHAN